MWSCDRGYYHPWNCHWWGEHLFTSFCPDVESILDNFLTCNRNCILTGSDSNNIFADIWSCGRSYNYNNDWPRHIFVHILLSRSWINGWRLSCMSQKNCTHSTRTSITFSRYTIMRWSYAANCSHLVVWKLINGWWLSSNIMHTKKYCGYNQVMKWK